MLFKSLLLASGAVALVKRSDYSDQSNVLQFDNLGFKGQYYPVSEIKADNSKECTCSKDMDNPVTFEGAIAPLNEEVSVHLRGPMNLLKFGWYYADSYSFGQTSGNWTRGAYFDALEGTSDNVTFLGNVGSANECLGNAFTYVDSTGLSSATSSTVLGNVTIGSAEEFAIMSSVECSGDDCGVYRAENAAYHGFYGTNKMFLFEFNAPSDLSEESKTNKTDNYDMPAIWLLNAQIPRTSQYPTNPNCSAWNAGAGEFDILEVMNVTERNHFYSTVHDFQGTDNIETGLQNFGYIERTPDEVMMGGVVFGEDGTATVFLSNSTTFDSSIANSDLSNWISNLESKGSMHEQTLSSVSFVAATTVSSISSSTHKAGAADSFEESIGWGLLSFLFSLIMGLI